MTSHPWIRHSDVFVDVQKKLDGHAQKHKTVEMQLASVAEETGEKLAALDVELAHARKEAKKDVEVTKRELTEAITEGLKRADDELARGLKAQDDKVERHQLIVEAILAKQQVRRNCRKVLT